MQKIYQNWVSNTSNPSLVLKLNPFGQLANLKWSDDDLKVKLGFEVISLPGGLLTIVKLGPRNSISFYTLQEFGDLRKRNDILKRMSKGYS